MKVETALGAQNVAEAGARARALEAQGFDGAFSFEGPHDPFLPIALAARETGRIELGTAIAVAFARNPMVCAQTAWDLQLLSGGRFYLGLGSQIRAHIEKRFSQTWSRPAARMREFVLAIRAIWRAFQGEERLDFRGEFYTHTLLTPFFNPGPCPFGPPRIFLAGVGPRMVRAAGEVADGFLVHPLHTRDYVLAETLPALEKGFADAGRLRGSFEIACQTIVMLGTNDRQLAAARQKACAQVSFYGSTPAYRVVLDHHGWGDLQPELNRLSKEGRWDRMRELVPDEMLDAVGVCGAPAAVAARLRSRNDFAQRTALVVYDETRDPDALPELLRALKA